MACEKINLGGRGKDGVKVIGIFEHVLVLSSRTIKKKGLGWMKVAIFYS